MRLEPEREHLRKQLLAVRCACERHRHLRWRLMWLLLQYRVPRVRQPMPVEHERERLRNELHALPGARQRDGHLRRSEVRVHVQPGLCRLGDHVCASVRNGRVHRIHLVQHLIRPLRERVRHAHPVQLESVLCRLHTRLRGARRQGRLLELPGGLQPGLLLLQLL